MIAARVNGALRDLAAPLAEGDEVEPVDIASEDGRAILRHSTAHVMAQAARGTLIPEAKLGIGPPVENGFYYDFDVRQPFGPDDLKNIEARMRAIVKQGQRFSRRVVSDGEARAELAKEPYKLELVGLKGAARHEGAPPSEVSVEESVEVGGAELTMYDNLDPRSGELRWKDLCRGPHLPTTRQIPAFKLMRSGGAYWRGSEQNPQLQRIYGTAWESRQCCPGGLPAPAGRRRSGATTASSAPSSACSRSRRRSAAAWRLFHPKGGTADPAGHGGVLPRQRHIEYGYLRVRLQPAHHQGGAVRDLGPPRLVQGEHVPAHADGGRGVLPQADELPVPHPDLPVARAVLPGVPLRLFEFGTVYRYEKSGVVHGLTRVRGLTMDDAHISLCTREQVGAELKSLLVFKVLDLLRDYGLTEFEAELSTRPEKFVGEIAEWEVAEAALQHALDQSGLPYVIAEGEGAFYAPKIDVHASGMRSSCAAGSCRPCRWTSRSRAGSASSTPPPTGPGSGRR